MNHKSFGASFLYWVDFTYSDLTLKCVANGDLPEKNEFPKRFEEKTVDHPSKFCASLTPLWPGPESLSICDPDENEDQGKEEQSEETEFYPDFVLISIDWPPKM